MRIVLAVALAGFVALTAATPAATGRAGATAAARCSGTLTEEVAGATLRVRSIRTTNMSCTSGKKLIRRFLRKADRDGRCRRASVRPPPTNGCAVGSFHCWRNTAKYCARRGQDVSWRDRPA
jgi:hypothetical protein